MPFAFWNNAKRNIKDFVNHKKIKKRIVASELTGNWNTYTWKSNTMNHDNIQTWSIQEKRWQLLTIR